MKIAWLLLAMLSLTSLAALSGAYVTQIHAIAVLQGEEKGILTPAYLNLTKGNGAVKFTGNGTVNQSTVASAQVAVGYATSYLNMNSLNYNFTYALYTNGSGASGPSGGLAFALLAISALQHKPISQNFAVTGTVAPNGGIGLIGGVYDKIDAAKAGGMRYVVVPYAYNSSFEYLLYYLSQQALGIPVVGVANVTQALPYAFNSAVPSPLGIGIYQNYSVGALPNANVTCRGCNMSAFTALANLTQSFARGYIQNITGNFSAAKAQFLSNLGEYATIEKKGYFYTAADFAFLDFVKAFMLYNARNLNTTPAGSVVSGVSSYCSSLVSPPLTNTNYEYVVGGTLRGLWANSTLNASRELLSSEETTDDAAQSVYDAGQALGWCKAKAFQYQIASSLGGAYMAFSPSLKSYVASMLNNVSGYGGNIYLTAAEQAYSSGDYATSLYALTYENAFGKPIPSNLTNSQMAGFVSNSISSSNFGIWPTEFSAQSEFYLNEANMATNASVRTGYLDQAYSTALLASGLSAANARLSASLVPLNSTSQGQVGQQLLTIQQEISQIYFLLLLMLMLMFVLFVAILVLALRRGPTPKPAGRPRVTRRRRQRR
jgi:predicted S18 family serine protease